MIWVGSREITMPRGWVVEFQDGSSVCEEDMPWGSVPNKKNIRRVMLKIDDRFWTLEGKECYTVPTTRVYVDVSAGTIGGQKVHSRTIGYYSTAEKCKIILRVEEDTGRATWETIPF